MKVESQLLGRGIARAVACCFPRPRGKLLRHSTTHRSGHRTRQCQPRGRGWQHARARALPQLTACVVLAAVLSAGSLWACSVPVFRYALEKWAPDAYQAIVFHRGPLTDAQQALARSVSGDGLAGQPPANVSLQTVDLAQNPAPEMLELWRQLGTETLPWLVVKYPRTVRLPDQLVSGPLAAATTRHLLDSPARQEITRRLAQGESAVWVLLEVGDRPSDDLAAKLVTQRLDYLATVLKLPTLEAQDIASGLVSVPAGGLKLAFSVLRVSRTDAAENVFVKMLLGSEPDLGSLKEPILFPVFGRGRALYALAGKGINHETLDEAATFLIGKCSCEVKELNPGVDLLLTADWARLVKAQFAADQGLPTLPSLAEAAPETVTISGAPENTPARADGARPPADSFQLTGVFALATLLVAGFFWWRKN